MIQVKTSIHDRFSVEFKINFSGREQQHRLFKMNSWLFVPSSLDINASTYSKEQFYQDVKSNVRLKTPQFTLQQLADPEVLTVRNLSAAVQKYAETPTSTCLQDLEFHIKMYVAIYKSALRDETRALQTLKESAFNSEAWKSHLTSMRRVVRHYREVMRNNSENSSDIASIFQYGDEYLSHLTELHAVRLMRSSTAISATGIENVREEIKSLIVEEHQYKIDQGYAHFSLSSVAENRDMFLHQNLLKKYIESAEFFWNSGIFIWNVGTIVNSLRIYEPEISKIFEDLLPYYGTEKEQELIDKVFPECPSISIDYAVMERADEIFVFPADFGWSDVGTWGSLHTLAPVDKEGNNVIGENVKLYETKNCVVHTTEEKRVVIQGLEGYIVAEKNNTLLICKLEEEQRIKEFSAE